MGHTFQILPGQYQFGPSSWEWYFLSIREKDKWILDAGGERFLLYKRRYEGQRCPNFDPVRETNRQHEDTICYGTGWISPNANPAGDNAGGPNYGFFAPVEIVVSTLTSGPVELALTDFGQQRIYKPVRNWTLWEPLITPGDMLVRRNNQRFLVTTVHPKRIKHYLLHQEFEMSEVERGSILYQLPNGL